MHNLKHIFFNVTLLRFLGVGVVNAIVGLSVMFLLYNLAGCGYWLSSAANYVTGGMVSFILNKFFTFNNRERLFGQIVRFVIVMALCYIAAYGVARPIAVAMLSHCSITVQENVAMVVGAVCYTILNYLFQRFFVFSNSRLLK